MEVVGDIPFMLHHGISFSAIFLSPSHHMNWAKTHGKFRDRPLTPIDNPLDVAEQLLTPERLEDRFDCTQYDPAKASDEEYLELIRRDFTQIIRFQALSMMKHLIPLNRDGRDGVSDAEWNTFLADARRRKINWDVEKQTFTEGRK